LDGAYILLGLLYDAGEIERWFAEAQGMKESSTYRRILEEGWQRGREEGRQEGWQEGRQEGEQLGWQRGRQEGWQEGRQEGWQEGRQEGQVRALRENVVLVYRERFGEVPAEVVAKVEAVEDVEQLRALLVSLLHVQRPEELKL